METVSFYTLGCRLNQAETAILERSFEKCGYRVVDYREPADVVVINTCTVTENGDADTRKIVNKINRINPQARIALVGCQAQIQREKLLELPGVTYIVGNARKMELAEILPELQQNQVLAPAISRESFVVPVAGVDSRHTRANLKIQDGCDFFCSFCEIPYARGRARSREFDDILREAHELVDAGHHELVLTGINLGTYQYDGRGVLDIIERLNAIPRLHRVRISSIEPTTIPLGLTEWMFPNGKLCRYLHIPVQTGVNRILEQMNRNYVVEDMDKLLAYFKTEIPEICLGTDVIVGFPGETEEDFRSTYDYLRQSLFDYFHVFSYSDRNLAKSRNFAAKVPVQEIEKRSKRLRELSFRKRRAYLEQFLGSEVYVLFEQKKGGLWTGLTDTYIRVNVKSEQNLENQFVPVRLERVEGQAMIGKLV